MKHPLPYGRGFLVQRIASAMLVKSIFLGIPYRSIFKLNFKYLKKKRIYII